MKLRPILDGDWPRLQDFVRRHFGFSHIPDRRFHEHWFRNPFAAEGEPWGGRLLERADGSLAGALMVIVLPAWFAGRETRLGYLSTGVVEADARKAGQGAALYLWAYRAYPLVLAMAGNELSAPLNALMGRDIPGVAMRRFLRLNRPEALALCPPGEAGRVSVLPAPPPAPARGLSADWVDRAPDDYEPLWCEVRAGLSCALDKTAAYLRWRCGAPYTDYRMLAVRSAGRLTGLAVCRYQETPAGQVARVTEMVARPGDAADVWAAIADATRDAVMADFLVVGTIHDTALAGGGFREATADNGLDRLPHLLAPVEHRQWTSVFTLGGPLALADQSWRSAGAVYFTKGDGDRDWPTLWDLERRCAPDQAAAG